MSSRFQRPRDRDRSQVTPVHRGPQALPLGTSSAAAPYGAFSAHAPNAALLIDFDNVTMGIQKDMQSELRRLLSSDIIRGKVSVQRAYADWRRYPGYIVPLTENSIDLIWAPAYGSAKKNATDIRLAVDAMELVFTRPEIGTFILLSGDSDFSSLVIKLKEYGKYVIGVGIRESSSDLLVQNCDEYYSYNALAGLVRAGDEEVVRWDPWELVTEAIGRMARNGDVMRADRLKQVMQDIDPSFDEKDLGMSKFSRFVHEASQRGLISLTRLDNGQYEIAPTGAQPAGETTAARREEPRREEPRREEPRRAPSTPEEPEVEAAESREAREAREGRREERGRGRRGRRGRGRDERAPRAGETEVPLVAAEELPPAPTEAPTPAAGIGVSGERLTRNEAFDLVRRAVESLVPTADQSVSADAVRARAFELLGRDSESLNTRMFERILRDAHDVGLIDLRRRGDTYELSRATEVESVADQFNRAVAAQSAAAPPPPSSPAAPRGMGPRGLSRGRVGGRTIAPPADLLSVGVVRIDGAATPAVAEPAESESAAPQPSVALEDGGAAAASVSEPTAAEAAPAETASGRGRRSRGGRGRGGRRGGAQAAAQPSEAAPVPAAPVAPPPAPEATAPEPAATSAARGRRGRGGRKSAAKTATKTATKTPAKTASKAAAKAPTAPPATAPPTQAGGRGRGATKRAPQSAPPAAAAPAAPPAGATPAASARGRGARKRATARRGA